MDYFKTYYYFSNTLKHDHREHVQTWSSWTCSDMFNMNTFRHVQCEHVQICSMWTRSDMLTVNSFKHIHREQVQTWSSWTRSNMITVNTFRHVQCEHGLLVFIVSKKRNSRTSCLLYVLLPGFRLQFALQEYFEFRYQFLVTLCFRKDNFWNNMKFWKKEIFQKLRNFDIFQYFKCVLHSGWDSS